MKKTLTAVAGFALATASFGQSRESYTYGETSGSYQGENFRNVHEERSVRAGRTGSSTEVKRLNRVSQLIGTQVRDRSNQEVGEVKDVVLDFDSGRLAYVVVDANKVLRGERSLIAVPARAIRVDSDQQAIRIEANRNRIQQLRAFSERNYPPIRGRAAQSANWRAQQETGALRFACAARQQRFAEPLLVQPAAESVRTKPK